MSNIPLEVVDGMMVSLDYKLRLEVNGRVIKASKKRAPRVFLQGEQQVVVGLEQALYGMVVGEEKHIKVEAVAGYGQIDLKAVKSIPRGRISTGKEIVPGMNIRLRNRRTGKVSRGRVVEAGSNNIVFDFNHRLAGKTLYYHVRIADLRPATPTEQMQGVESSEQTE